MSRRTYGQNCGLAIALDLLGERWTMLVIREVALGPKRFGELAGMLPGIGTNILAARLKLLEDHDVVRRARPSGSAGATAYELTARGRQLEPMLDGLALWGFPLLAGGTEERETRASWVALSMRGVYERDPDPDLRVVAEFSVADEVLHVDVVGEHAHVRHGPATRSDVRVTTDLPTFLDLAERSITLASVGGADRLEIEGDARLLDRLLSRFHLPVEAPASA